VVSPFQEIAVNPTGEPGNEGKGVGQEPDTKMRRYQPPDDLMKFLQAL